MHFITSRLASRGLVLAGMVLVPLPAYAQDSNGGTDGGEEIPSSFTLSTGVSYSSGDYGELEDTEVIAIPISASYRYGDLRVRISIPWVQVNGPGSLLSTPDLFDGGGDSSGQGRGRGRGRSGEGDRSSNSGSGSGGDIEVEDDDDLVDDDDVTDDDGFAAADNQRSGFGDVNISVAYSVELGETTWFEPSVRVKIPTASRSDRLGTGEVDFTLAADLVQQVGDATVYVHGRRRFVGQPEGSTIGSTWGAGAGVSYYAGGGFSVGADYSWQESAFDGRPASSDVSAWVSTRLGSGFRITAYGGSGLNSNSADIFGGLTLSRRF